MRCNTLNWTTEMSRTPCGSGSFLRFMTNLVSTSDLQNIAVVLITFLVGVLAKAHLPFGKSTSDTLNLLQKDYEVMKKLYDAKVDELDKKDEIINLQRETIAEARARTTSLENFLQMRTYETDRVLKRVPTLLEALANHLQIEIPEPVLNGHETAHSQSKTNGNNNT